MTTCYLRIGSDYLEDASRCQSVNHAVDKYRSMVDEFNRFGNTPPEASIHIAKSKDELQEYPDFVLSAGPRGGVRKERT